MAQDKVTQVKKILFKAIALKEREHNVGWSQLEKGGDIFNP